MSKSPTTSVSNSTSNGIHQPRARKPVLSSPLARGPNEELMKPLTIPERTPLGTPAPPDDAPPSVKATSAARRELRRKSKRMFPTVEYQERVSYFDPKSDYSNFRGFFVLFWVGLAIMVITSMLHNLRESGRLLNFRQWPLFTQNIYELGALDLLMSLSTGVNLPLNMLYKNSSGFLRWDKGGMYLQSVVQAIWLWTWIATSF